MLRAIVSSHKIYEDICHGVVDAIHKEPRNIKYNVLAELCEVIRLKFKGKRHTIFTNDCEPSIQIYNPAPVITINVFTSVYGGYDLRMEIGKSFGDQHPNIFRIHFEHELDCEKICKIVEDPACLEHLAYCANPKIKIYEFYVES